MRGEGGREGWPTRSDSDSGAVHGAPNCQPLCPGTTTSSITCCLESARTSAETSSCCSPRTISTSTRWGPRPTQSPALPLPRPSRTPTPACHPCFQHDLKIEDGEDLQHDFERLKQAMEMVGFLPATRRQ